MAIKLIISGCCGRMGQAIARCALEDPVAFEIGAALESSGKPRGPGLDYSLVLGQPLPKPILIIDVASVAISRSMTDKEVVLIEFTTPEATVEHTQHAQKKQIPMVIGTTGLSDAQQTVVREAAKTIPIVFSPNMSLGVNVLYELAQLAAERLGGAFYDVEIVESHHREKKDAPSGTAKRLRERLVAAQTVRRPEIPIHSIRAGDIVGDHTVILAGPSERLELTHRAHGREVFARGALAAARFLVAQPPGLYDMSHVLRTFHG
ncbi:MAG: 4-hydroxy-tetrahydrodipicolinate reductase [Candidatus Omnitrophota bacterium]|nr:4-hydroxy-tetrahydrodipicolinate reductase [Candidatus Omnitrophota bacterium]